MPERFISIRFLCLLFDIIGLITIGDGQGGERVERHKDEHIDTQMLVIQANIDDMNPEMTPYVADKLFEAGANDVYWIPIVMKKGRPGVMLNVLASRDKLEEMERIIFRETTTIGLRYSEVVCHRLGRQSVQVETAWGAVRVKAGYFGGELVQYAPEYRDCEQIARTSGLPLKQVYDEVRRRFQEMQDGRQADGKRDGVRTE
jgi:hypothetical protein